MKDRKSCAEGARNMLVNCAGLEKGADLLIVREWPELGWYDRDAPAAVAREAEAMGMKVSRLSVGGPGNARSSAVAEAVAQYDCTIFFARIGDQDRFAEPEPGKTVVMSYIRDSAMLGSSYGTADHRALKALKDAIDDVLLGARAIEITCPLGTELTGGVPAAAREERADVSVRRFPLGVPQPVDAGLFSGRVALAHYLTPTGSKVYEPAHVEIDQPVYATVERGRLGDIEGNPETVRRVREHYRTVSDQFGIDGDVVHSWHAGFHPASAYTRNAGDDPDRWSNTVFTNPRFLHFHTCGDYAPGEICWMVLDQTVMIDGTALWESGRFRADAFPETAACLEQWPILVDLFAEPSDQIGLPNGHSSA